MSNKMELYYVEYNPTEDDNRTIAHFLEVTGLGFIMEHWVLVNEKQRTFQPDWFYKSWSEYYRKYKGGKAYFNKHGKMVRLK